MIIESRKRDYVLKEGLQHFLKEFLEEFFPKVLENLEVNLEPLKNEDTNCVQFEKEDSHLVYEARSLKTGEKIILHIKMQSHSKEELPYKMLDYDFELRKKHNAKVESIVLGLMDYPIDAPNFFEERGLINGEVERYFCFNQVHLKRLNWEDYKDKAGNPIVLCFLGLMNNVEKEKDEIRLFSYINLLRMKMNDEKKQVVLRIFEAYLPFEDKEKENTFRERLNKLIKIEGLEEEFEQLKFCFI